jgi:hypothetical protein
VNRKCEVDFDHTCEYEEIMCENGVVDLQLCKNMMRKENFSDLLAKLMQKSID